MISLRCVAPDDVSRPRQNVARTRVDLSGHNDSLRAVPLFRGIAGDAMEALAAASIVRRIEKGRRIGNESTNGDCAVILRGRAKRTIARGRTEGELVLDVIGDGDVVSESCMVRAEHAFAGETVALEHSLVLFISRRVMDGFLERQPAVALRLLEVMALRLARASTLAAQNACMEAGDRLYCRLVELAVTRGTVSREGLLVEHGLTQRELAGFSAASREIANRQLAEWRDNGWITARRYSVLIHDVDALTRSVSPAARWVGFGAGDGRNAFAAQ